jgi:pilus assembly protein CpaB
MNRTWLVLVGFLALALGIFVSHQVYRTVQSKTASAKAMDAVVAANDIQVGARIEDHDLKVVEFAPENLPPGVYHLKSGVVGRRAVLPITKGEFILNSKLAAENAGSGLPSLIPPGMRAVSVRVNDIVQVAGFVTPGTRVDVLLTGNPVGSNEQLTTTVLANVPVIAAGQKLERNAAGEPQTVPVITTGVSGRRGETDAGQF